MAVLGRPRKEDWWQRDANFQHLYGRAYYIPVNASLADVNLEEGDALPDNADAEIIEAEIRTYTDKKGGVATAAHVVAREQQYDAT